MRIPLGRRGLIAIAAAGGAVAFWRVRARRRQREELEWEAEVMGAIEEGRGVGESAGNPADAPSGRAE